MGEVAEYPGRAPALWPHRIPTTPDAAASTPQKTHGQNGIIGHSAARLLSWPCCPHELFVQVEALTAVAFTEASGDDWTSCKRTVSGSNPLTGSK
jgi:hypothetical protein